MCRGLLPITTIQPPAGTRKYDVSKDTVSYNIEDETWQLQKAS